MEKYTQAIIDLIAHGATPEDVCAEIGLCSVAIQSLQQEDDIFSEEEESRVDPKCTVCVYLVNAIDDTIEDPSDVEKVKEFLEGMCAHMPSEGIKKECKVG